MNIKPHHPLQELLGQLLFGIETIPPKEQRKAVNRACREAVKWHEEQMQLSSYKRDEINRVIPDVFIGKCHSCGR